jgi:hypothetical protein
MEVKVVKKWKISNRDQEYLVVGLTLNLARAFHDSVQISISNPHSTMSVLGNLSHTKHTPKSNLPPLLPLSRLQRR